MIAHLFGIVRTIRPSFLVLDVQGVGYKVACTTNTLEQLKVDDEVGLHTHLAVREDAMELFGFATHQELELFTMLLGVSGVGPRSALGIVGLDSITKLANAIAHSDIGYLTKVSGVGKKSAEKLVLELKEKVLLLDLQDVGTVRQDEEDILEALKALGYRADEAREALRQVADGVTEQSARIREALRILSRG